MKNGLGASSLILGILSLIFAWIPFLGFGSYATSIIGIVGGVYGRRRVRFNYASNGGVATAGIVTSTLGLVSVVIATVAYSALLYSASQEPTAGTEPTSVVATSGGSEPGTSKPATKDEPAAGIGDKVRDGDLRFTVKGVEDGVAKVGPQYFEEKAQGQFVIVTVRVKNVGDEAATFLTDDQLLFDRKGREYKSDGEAIIMAAGDGWIEEINPGNATTVKVIFDVPKKVKPATIELHGGLFSAGVIVNLG